MHANCVHMCEPVKQLSRAYLQKFCVEATRLDGKPIKLPLLVALPQDVLLDGAGELPGVTKACHLELDAGAGAACALILKHSGMANKEGGTRHPALHKDLQQGTFSTTQGSPAHERNASCNSATAPLQPMHGSLGAGGN
eukprot:1158665-Pelagomonas_calceolata.AAC.8